ncbi:peptidoglycan-binding domain-containing protein [Streptomyces subrutilus]|uniref:peptidoglycan-binding domain-containing protein n=1 Tax=Streptomyces subrutilus TaxID=36818 RepID=UPI0033D3F251
MRPYVGSPGGPLRSAGSPAWLQTGPLSFPGPAPSRAAAPGTGAAPGPAPGPAAAPAAEPAPQAGVDQRRGGGPALVIGGLLALAVAGGIVLLPGGSDPQPPPRSERAPELSVPVLPARSPGADSGAGPEDGASAPSGKPSATAGASASAGASAPAAAPSPKATPPPSTPAEPSGPPGTLRMGDRGPEVRALQELLFGQGFTYVSVTGVYDGQTKRGVSQLQRDRDIKGDPQGVYGPATRAALT